MTLLTAVQGGSRHVALGLALATALGLLAHLLAPGWAHAGLNQWTSNGPYGGSVQAVVVGPGAPAPAYISGCGGIFASVTGGAGWTSADDDLPANTCPNLLAVDPKDAAILYAAGSAGLFKTVDAGKNWVLTPGPAARVLAIDPANSNTLYAGNDSGVYKSMDGGNSWKLSSTNLPGAVNAIVVDPHSPAIVYVATRFFGIFKSTDAAGSWNPSSTGLPASIIQSGFEGVQSLAITLATPTTLYAGLAAHATGVFKSVNGGATWTPSGLLNYSIYNLVVDPETSSIVYAVSSDAVFKSVDAGAVWVTITNGLPSNGLPNGLVAPVIALDPLTPTTIYAAVAEGVFKSTDGGASWRPVNAGLLALGLSIVVAHPKDAATVFAAAFTASASGGIYRSTNGGGSWALLPGGVSANVLAIDPQAPTTIYAGGFVVGVGQGFFKSADGGNTWTPSGVGLSGVTVIAVDPTDSTTVYVVNGVCGQLSKSTNAGGSFGSLPLSCVTTVAVDPAQHGTLYAGTAPHSRVAGATFKSLDGGLTWSQVLTVAATAIVIDPRNAATIYVGSSAGIFKSTDSGFTWASMATGLDGSAIVSLAIDPASPNVLYVATQQGGVFRSQDGAASWAAMNIGLTVTGVDSLTVAASGACIYAGTIQPGGVFAFAVRPDPCVPAPLVAAVLPASRSAQVSQAVTAFVSVINTGMNAASKVDLSLATPLAAIFTYQTTNPATNQVTGTPNTPVDISAGGSQSYVIAVTPTAAFAETNVALGFSGANTAPPRGLVGVNTLLLSASTVPVPDIVALAATLANDGIVNVPGTNGTGVFSVATVNVGAGGNITASADTGGVTLPLTISLCQTNPTTGVCTSAVGPTVTTQITANATPTFGIFVMGTGTVPFDPVNNRVFVRFRDAGGATRGATSVAVRTR